MRRFLDYICLAAVGATGAAALSGQAHALLILPTFDNSFMGQPNAVALENAITTAATTIDGLYGNPGTVPILFRFNAGLSGASTMNADHLATSPTYAVALAADSAAHPGNTVLATSVANLTKGNMGSYVADSTAYYRVALGFAAVTPCFDATGGFVSACNAVYDSIVTIGNANTTTFATKNSQAITFAEHEINEVLGGGGGGSAIGEDFSGSVGAATVLGPTDFYRYQSSGTTCANVNSTPSYTTNQNALTCYSYDGGVSSLVQFNQGGAGSDFGDFATTTPNIPYIQDAFYPGATDFYTTASPEFIMMETIGYNPIVVSSVPEPATIALFAPAFAGMGWLRRRPARAS